MIYAGRDSLTGFCRNNRFDKCIRHLMTGHDSQNSVKVGEEHFDDVRILL